MCLYREKKKSASERLMRNVAVMDLSKEGDGCYFSNTNKIYLSPLPFLCIMKDKSKYGRVDVLLPHFLHLLLKQALPPQTPLSLLKTCVFFIFSPKLDL